MELYIQFVLKIAGEIGICYIARKEENCIGR